jgi:hypothetical protein
MKTKINDQKSSVTGALLEHVVQQDKDAKATNFPAPSVGKKPIPAPDQYQDSGSGYNRNFTFPQD